MRIVVSLMLLRSTDAIVYKSATKLQFYGALKAFWILKRRPIHSNNLISFCFNPFPKALDIIWGAFFLWEKNSAEVWIFQIIQVLNILFISRRSVHWSQHVRALLEFLHESRSNNIHRSGQYVNWYINKKEKSKIPTRSFWKDLIDPNILNLISNSYHPIQESWHFGAGWRLNRSPFIEQTLKTTCPLFGSERFQTRILSTCQRKTINI